MHSVRLTSKFSGYGSKIFFGLAKDFGGHFAVFVGEELYQYFRLEVHIFDMYFKKTVQMLGKKWNF